MGIVQSITFDEGAFPFRGVVDVGFTLLDVDQGSFQDQVQIIAYDPRGNVLDPSVVTLTPVGSASTESGDTASGQAAAANGESIGNVQVAIAAEVGRVDIVFTVGPDPINGSTLQEVGIGPLSFTSIAIFDDSDEADDGQVTGDDNDNVARGHCDPW